jgi:hypothetical protein
MINVNDLTICCRAESGDEPVEVCHSPPPEDAVWRPESAFSLTVEDPTEPQVVLPPTPEPQVVLPPTPEPQVVLPPTPEPQVILPPAPEPPVFNFASMLRVREHTMLVGMNVPGHLSSNLAEVGRRGLSRAHTPEHPSSNLPKEHAPRKSNKRKKRV